MKKRVIIIGGGVIMRHYAEGLKKSNAVEAVALCDLDENCPARELFCDLPFFTDYQEAIEVCAPDGAIVATNVRSHAEIAKNCLKAGLHVYVEKPLCTDGETLDDLYEAATKAEKNLTALFHWKFADEVLFLKGYVAGKKIRRIAACIGDDYACEPIGRIRKDRIGLSGAWFDSGINVLSYVQELLPLEGVRLVEKEARIDDSCSLPYYARRIYDAGGTELEIVVDWTIPSRKKTSVIELEGETLYVDHTAQRIERDGEVIFESKVPDRLASHYKNMFARAMDADADEESRLLHEILLQG